MTAFTDKNLFELCLNGLVLSLILKCDWKLLKNQFRLFFLLKRRLLVAKFSIVELVKMFPSISFVKL